jgi:5-hydroxyisourate hydrolase/2-oxo-4-hydroxy-4-carboxy-5-ureidoimidazoline decarboxylase
LTLILELDLFWILELDLKFKTRMYSLNEFNQLSIEKAAAELFKCCGSTLWVKQLMEYFPFEKEQQLFHQVQYIWYSQSSEADYLEAFTHHPKIGGVESLKKKFAATQDWAENEQAGVANANLNTVEALAQYNEDYFNKFGYIFIVCATDKSADEMLQLLNLRITHPPKEELGIAMGEQHKITLIRLKKLFQFQESFWNEPSQITTHVLDTSIGKPGARIPIKLKKRIADLWQTIALGITNKDGRIGDLLPAGVYLNPGHYQMCFDTQEYFESQNTIGFYPQVTIDFNTFDQSHYHVPLLINPFGYSTYRGS